MPLEFSEPFWPRSRAGHIREPQSDVVRPVMLDLDDATARAAIDRLHCAAGVHVSARLSWAQAWRDADPRARPWVLGLRGPGGDLRALAMLSMSRRAGVAQIRCLGHAVLDRAPIVSRGAADAHDLAEALAAELRALRRPWTLHLRQLPVGDAFAGALARRLVAVDSLPDGQRPLTLVTGDAARTPIVSRNLRKTEARARNRIARAGLACDIGWVCDGRQIALRMPEIRSVHRARDVQLRGYSTLDDPVEGAFYDALFGRHLDALELLEVRLDGQLAAYLVWIRNREARLVLDNRVAPRWTDYSAGIIATNTALRAAAADPAIEVLDWGSGVQRYKLQAATVVIAQHQLHAWSSLPLRRVLHARRRFSRPCRPGRRSWARS